MPLDPGFWDTLVLNAKSENETDTIGPTKAV